VFRSGAAYVVVGWLLIQAAETVFPLFGFGYTPARIVVIVLAIGFIPALILAWAFELTPEGLKREEDIDRNQPESQYAGKKLDRIIIVVLVISLAYFAFDKFVLTLQRDAAQQEQQMVEVQEAREEGRTEALVMSYGDNSIAVLPFVNMSSDEEQEYFSDGISEELLNLLAKIPEMRVISRTSAFFYKGKDIKLADIGRELSVAHILEGSVRKAGNQVRITAQLIEVRSDSHLWSETYDRSLDNIFAIQDEIAAEVVAQLKITLLGAAPQVRQSDPEAYALYLQARQAHRQVTASSYERAVILYQKALAVDPGYAAAWRDLAAVYVSQVAGGLRPSDEGYRLAQETAAKALSIDPKYAPTHDLLGVIAMLVDGDLATAALHIESALNLEPANPDILVSASMLLKSLGRLDEGTALLEYVVARDPLSPRSRFNLAHFYLAGGRLDEAIASYRTVLSLSPDSASSHYLIGIALLLGGEPEAALVEMQQEPSVWREIGLPMVYHALQQLEKSDTTLAGLIEKIEQDGAINIAQVLAYRGEADRAFEWLDKAVASNEPGLSDISTTLEFNNLHDDPRWKLILESIGKSPEQLAAIEFSVIVPE